MPDKRKNDSPNKDSQHPPKQRTLRSNMESCRICKGSTTPQTEPAVKCSECGDLFHLSCAGVSANFFSFYIQQKKKAWHCYTCDCEHREATKANAIAINNIESLANHVSDQVKSISTELLKLKNQDNSWKQEFECKISDVIDQRIEEKLSTIRGDPAPQHSTQATTHSNTANAYSRNLIITGIPEHENENVIAIVRKLAKQINFTLPNFIDNCFRIKKKSNTNANPRPPTILLKFTTELGKDSFFNCYFSYIKKRKLTPNDIDMVGEDRIYVNEHLNPDLNPTLKRALALRRDGKVLQVASHSTHISIKMTSNGRPKWFRVKDVKSLDTLARLDQGDSGEED